MVILAVAVYQPELANMHILKHASQSLPYTLLSVFSVSLQRFVVPERQALRQRVSDTSVEHEIMQ